MKRTSQVFSASTSSFPSLTIFILFILLSGCLEFGQDHPTTKVVKNDPDQYEILSWKNDTYLKPKNETGKVKPYIKIVSPTSHDMVMERIGKIKVKANDTGQALSYILLDENRNWINETSYLPEFNYKPKYGKQTLYMLSVYLDGSRSFDTIEFDVKDKKEDYKRECSIGNYTDWAVSGNKINKAIHLSCDLVIRANQTVEIRNSTIVFEGANKSLFYDYPNTSIGYEIRVKPGGRLIVYNSSFTALNGYWNGFIFENESVVDWYYDNGSVHSQNNVNISYAFRPGIVYQQVWGISTIDAHWDNKWMYTLLLFKEKYEILKPGLFYQSVDRVIIMETERPRRGQTTFMFERIRLY